MDEEYRELLVQMKQGQKPSCPPNPPVGGTDGGQLSNYDKFLGALTQGNHPRFCELIWDGEVFSVVITVHFQKAPDREVGELPRGGDEVRRRAWNYFKRFDRAEQKLMQFRVMIKDWLPVHAVVTMRPEAAGVLRLGTARLRELQTA